MFPRIISLSSTTLTASALVMLAGCSSESTHVGAPRQAHTEPARASTPAYAEPTRVAADWPAKAAPGECWAKVYIQPTTNMVAERVMTQDAIEKVETVPARYEWVEEQRVVKEACSELREVPAQYKMVDKTIELEPARTSWVLGKSDCKTAEGQPAANVYCLVTLPPVTKTVQQRVCSAPATVTEVPVPAKYETVRREKLVAAATTKKTSIPAEFDTVQKTVVVAPGRWEWQQVMCEPRVTANHANEIKTALVRAGYRTGPQDGSLGVEDWNSIRAYQLRNNLGIGGLTYETLNKLGISPESMQTSSR